jgi:hypothetical protein
MSPEAKKGIICKKKFDPLIDAEYISRLPKYIARHNFRGERVSDIRITIGE